MRNLYLTVSLFCFCFFANAQLINVCNSLSCADLRSPIDVINTVVPRLSYAKPPLTTPVYKDVLYNVENCVGNGDDLTFDSLDVPGTTTCTDEKSSLVFDVYYPTNNNYTVCKLPALILFHGGSYLECSDLTNPGVVELCQDFAQRGFVVFSVEYRRGVLAESTDDRVVTGGIPSGIGYTTAQQFLAIYRACQDARGAIRSIVKYENTGWGHDDQ